jgi:monothiol glutaredoxin
MRIDFVQGEQGAGFKITNPNEPARVRPLGPKDLKALLDQGKKLALIDVRTDEERAIATIEPSKKLDENELAKMDKSTPLVFYCHHGMRSRRAADHFLQQGFQEVYNLEGGIDAWSQTVDPSVKRY